MSTNKLAIDALTEARNWFQQQRRAISKGSGSTWDMLQCSEQEDLLDTAIAALAPTVQDAEQGIDLPKLPEQDLSVGPELYYGAAKLFAYGKKCILADRAALSPQSLPAASDASAMQLCRDMIRMRDAELNEGGCDVLELARIESAIRALISKEAGK